MATLVERHSFPWLTILALLICSAPLRGASGDAVSGVVVEEVATGSPAERAGVRPADVIVSWSRVAAPPNPEAAQGAVVSPFDLADVEVEQAPRGRITLGGRRDESAMSWTLPPGSFGLTVRPQLGQDLLALYEEGDGLVRSKKVSEGAARWSAAGEAAQKQEKPLVGTWFLARAAKALVTARVWAEADAAYEQAVRRAEESGKATATAQLLTQWAEALRSRSNWPAAEDRYRRVLALEEKRSSENLTVALTLNNLGVTAMFRGDLAAAEKYTEQALAIRGKLAPGSLTLGASLNNLGSIAWNRGDLVRAGEYFRRNFEIERELAPVSLEAARTLNNLGLVARASGDLAGAEDFHRRSLGIKEKLAPDSLDVAASLKNLGVLARSRGELATAEEYHRRALDIEERLAPGTSSVARSLNNLAIVAKNRGDLAAAEAHGLRAVELEEKLAPGSPTLPNILGNLGDVARDQGDPAKAEDYYRRALAIAQQHAPGGLLVSLLLHSLGVTATERADLPAAEEYHRRALEIRGKLAGGTSDEAESLHALGLIYRRTGRTDAASALLLRALDALESQNAKLGGTEEVRSLFAAGYESYYHDAITGLIEQGKIGEAVQVLERSRARSLLALLAERDLPFSADLSPELARERKQADSEYDRIQARIARLNPAKEDAEIQKAFGQLRELRARQEGIASRIRQASPRFASLHYPIPLDMAGVRGALDAGTLLVAYSVGTERTVVFAVEPAGAPGLGVFVATLPIGENALREKVAAFRQAAQEPVPTRRAALAAQAGELYDILIKPVESQIGASERLLLSLAGPLHSLPFGALVRKGAGKRPTRYLIEWKPLHVVASATVYAELKKARREAGASRARLVAFGDPQYPPQQEGRTDWSANPDVRSFSQAFHLTPLPFTRQEIDSIARLFPARAEKYLGERATEERAKALDRDVSYIHFACHGYLDERFPLNSSLALTIPETPAEGQDNGLLQAWEIFDKVRIDADLVTLSACGTALGREMGGEGLLGLTRAFHYAGARSVLATLWGVSDTSTPLLMKRFYAHLKAGASRDRALQAAQVDFIRGRAASGPVVADLSHPFRWAAFQLSGDWR